MREILYNAKRNIATFANIISKIQRRRTMFYAEPKTLIVIYKNEMLVNQLKNLAYILEIT